MKMSKMMMTVLLAPITALTVGACASSQTGHAGAQEPAPTAHQGAGHGDMMSHEMADMCPMDIHDTTAVAEESEGGAAILFTTTGDETELRRRIEHMAQMHNQHHGGAGQGMHGADRAGSTAEGSHDQEMRPPMSTARVEEVDAGARIVFTPQDPANLESLREHVGDHVSRMASGECPMMEDAGAPSPSDEGHIHGTDHEQE
jgi:hypothetical protein